MFSPVLQARETRNEIKSEYRRLREEVRKEQRFETEFGDTTKLGDTLEYFHYRLISLIKESCFESANGEFEPVEGKTNRIQRRLHIQIYLIKIKNVFSFLFWLILILAIIAIVVAVATGVSTYIGSVI